MNILGVDYSLYLVLTHFSFAACYKSRHLHILCTCVLRHSGRLVGLHRCTRHILHLFSLMPHFSRITHNASPGSVRSFELVYSSCDWFNVSNVGPLSDTLEVLPCDCFPKEELRTILVRFVLLGQFFPIDVRINQYLAYLMKEVPSQRLYRRPTL